MEPLALPIRARFVPLRGLPACSLDWCIPRIPGGRFSVVLLAPGGGLALFVPAAGAGCRIGTIPIASRLPLRRWPGTRRCRWDGRPA